MKLDDEDKTIILLSSSPKYFENLKDVLICGKEGLIILEEAKSSTRTKKLTNIKKLNVDDSEEDLKVSRGISEIKGNKYG